MYSKWHTHKFWSQRSEEVKQELMSRSNKRTKWTVVCRDLYKLHHRGQQGGSLGLVHHLNEVCIA